MKLHVTVDGCCCRQRTSAGVVLRDAETKTLLFQQSVVTQGRTNNQAEYLSLLAGCFAVAYYIKEKGEPESITFFSDSQIVVRQLGGMYRTRNEELKKLQVKVSYDLCSLRAKLKWHSREDGDGPLADTLSKEAQCKSQSSGLKKTLNENSARNWRKAVSKLSQKNLPEGKTNQDSTGQ